MLECKVPPAKTLQVHCKCSWSVGEHWTNKTADVARQTNPPGNHGAIRAAEAMMLCLGQEAIMSRGRKDPLSREPDPKRTSCEREKVGEGGSRAKFVCLREGPFWSRSAVEDGCGFCTEPEALLILQEVSANPLHRWVCIFWRLNWVSRCLVETFDQQQTNSRGQALPCMVWSTPNPRPNRIGSDISIDLVSSLEPSHIVYH